MAPDSGKSFISMIIKIKKHPFIFYSDYAPISHIKDSSSRNLPSRLLLSGPASIGIISCFKRQSILLCLSSMHNNGDSSRPNTSSASIVVHAQEESRTLSMENDYQVLMKDYYPAAKDPAFNNQLITDSNITD